MRIFIYLREFLAESDLQPRIKSVFTHNFPITRSQHHSSSTVIHHNTSGIIIGWFFTVCSSFLVSRNLPERSMRIIFGRSRRKENVLVNYNLRSMNLCFLAVFFSCIVKHRLHYVKVFLATTQ